MLVPKKTFYDFRKCALIDIVDEHAGPGKSEQFQCTVSPPVISAIPYRDIQLNNMRTVLRGGSFIA